MLRDGISAGTDMPVATLDPAHSFPLLLLPRPFDHPRSSAVSCALDDVPVGALDLARVTLNPGRDERRLES